MEAITRLTFGGFGTQTAYLAISQIDSVDFAPLTFRIKRVTIVRIEQNIKAITTGERGPIRVANTLLILPPARPDPVLIVLETTSNSKIWFRIVERNPIILSCGNLVQMVPVFAAGETLINATIGDKEQTLANLRFRGLVFVFRFGRLRRRHGAGLNRERMTIRMNFLA